MYVYTQYIVLLLLRTGSSLLLIFACFLRLPARWSCQKNSDRNLTFLKKESDDKIDKMAAKILAVMTKQRQVAEEAKQLLLW